MPACARDCLFEVTAAIAASAADITLLRSIMKSLDENFALRFMWFNSTKHSATRGARPLNKSLWGLPQGHNEVGAFAGFAALVDAVIGHDDRTAGGQDLCDPRHRLGSDGDAVQRLGGAVRHRQRLGPGKGSSRHLAAPCRAVVPLGPARLAGRCRRRNPP